MEKRPVDEMSFEEFIIKMEECGIETKNMKEVARVYTAEEWFDSQDAKDFYKCYENVLSDEKYRFKRNSLGMENQKYYIMAEQAYGNPIVYHYYELDGVRRLATQHVSFSCIHDGGCHQAYILLDRAIEIVTRNWANTKENWNAFKKRHTIIYR